MSDGTCEKRRVNGLRWDEGLDWWSVRGGGDRKGVWWFTEWVSERRGELHFTNIKTWKVMLMYGRVSKDLKTKKKTKKNTWS